MILRPYQAKGKILNKESFQKGNTAVLTCVPTGGGKCLGRGTPILMFDGTIKNVEDVKKDDLLIGPDSKKRKVLSITNGFDQLYKVVLKNNDSFICNESHILSLICNSSVTKRFIKNNVYNLPILEYISLPAHIKHCLKSYKTGIELPEKKIKIDPYFLGLWLGDGDSKGTMITNMDIEIEKYLYSFAESINHKISKFPNGLTKAFRYSIIQKITKWHSGLLQDLRNINVINNKHIPDDYLRNSKKIRLQLLAGLIDTDGHLHHNSYEISTCSPQLAKDIRFLARSLGFNVSCKRSTLVNAYRILISGHTEKIPVLIKRKKAATRQQIKNVNRYQFKVEKINIGEYFGFEISGDRRFLLGDFTVTHNTVMFSDMAKESISNGVPAMIVCDRRELIDQAEDKLKACGLNPTLIVPSYRDKVSNLYLASVDTLRNRKWPNVGYLIPDECHERKFDEICLKFKKAGGYISGFTATPIRSGKAFLDEFEDYTGQLGDIYDDMVIPTTVSDLIKGDEVTGETYLVPSITYSVKTDNSELKTSKSFGELDYSKESMFQKANNSFSYASVVNKYIELTPNTKFLCFNINVEHSIKQAQEFNMRGIPTAHVDGTTPLSERKKIFKDFKYGILKGLCNVGVATKGYDEPTIETIIVNRATMSLSLWLQMCGRGGRPCDEIGKTFFNIIDMFGNVYTHLWWEYEHEWSLKKDYISKTIGVAPIKECEHCQAIIALTATTCKHCLLLQTKKEVEAKILLDAGEFEIVDKDNIPKELKKPLAKLTIKELERFRELKGYSVSWVVRQLLVRGEDDMREYARMKNYAEAWVTKQIDISEKGREETKQLIWKFIQENPHIDEAYLKDYAAKKLKSNHTIQQIEYLLPLMVQGFKDFHAGLIKVDAS